MILKEINKLSKFHVDIQQGILYWSILDDNNNLDFSWIKKFKFSNIKYNINKMDLTNDTSDQLFHGVKKYHVISFENIDDLEIVNNEPNSNFYKYIKTEFDAIKNQDLNINFILMKIFTYFSVLKKTTIIDMYKFKNYLSTLIFLKIAKDSNLINNAIDHLELIDNEFYVISNEQKILLTLSDNEEITFKYNFEKLDKLIEQKNTKILIFKPYIKDENHNSIEVLLNEIIDYDNSPIIRELANYFLEYNLIYKSIYEYDINLFKLNYLSYKDELLPTISIDTNLKSIKTINLTLKTSDEFIDKMNFEQVVDFVKKFIG